MTFTIEDEKNHETEKELFDMSLRVFKRYQRFNQLRGINIPGTDFESFHGGFLSGYAHGKTLERTRTVGVHYGY